MSRGRITIIYGLRFGRITPGSRGCLYFRSPGKDSMQNGSLTRRKREYGPEVWEFRWRKPGPNGIRRHRRIIFGSTDQIEEEFAARKAIAALQIDINQNDIRMKKPTDHSCRCLQSFPSERTEYRNILE